MAWGGAGGMGDRHSTGASSMSYSHNFLVTKGNSYCASTED